MMKLKKLGFLTVVGAGVLVMLATLALPATQTFGLETDVTGLETDVPAAAAPVVPSVTALPPAAPVESTGAAALPSAGSGGYLNSGGASVLGFALLGIGIALVGSGSAVWAFGRRR